ncbi:hypothetical protein JTE90_009263 [Oedothorax gibbosus]|uniref:Uncharacterized protein n=1 Tax=Oedothorax gibbosus TaxID=931172 RepID=A0AAV6V491_9ARAC|nr:hypothetical protein JTE90_009263 [Oedothorax gibbosus]
MRTHLFKYDLLPCQKSRIDQRVTSRNAKIPSQLLSPHRKKGRGSEIHSDHAPKVGGCSGAMDAEEDYRGEIR